MIAFGVGTACIATKQSYVSKGNKLYDAGKYADASLNYRKALQKDPGFGEAYYRLGLSAIKQNQAREAYNALYRAVQLLPNRTDVTEKFADVCLSFYLQDPSHPQALYKQIQQLSEELLRKNPNSYEGVMLKAYLAQTDRKPKEAIALFRRALQINSSDPGVTTSLVQNLMQDGQPQEAEKVALDLIYRQKTSYSKIYDLMYGVYFNENKPVDAENIMKAKVNNNPKQAGYRLDLARHYSRVRRPDEMKATLQALLDDPKDFPQARRWVGDFYLAFRDYDEAVRNYEAGAHSLPAGKERIAYKESIMVTRLSQGKMDEAAREAGEILKEDPQNESALRLEADNWLATGKPDKIEAALRTFEKLSSRHPDDPVLRYHLGRSYREKGDLEHARNQFLEAIKRRRDFLRARYELVEIDLLQRRLAEAAQQTSEILAIKPKDERGLLLEAQCAMARGDAADLTAARNQLNGLIKNSPQATGPELQLGLLELKQSHFREAADIFQKLRSKGEAQGFLGLATTFVSEKQYDQAISVLRDGLKKWPDSTQIMAQLATTEALAGSYDLAISHFQKLAEADPKSAQYRLRIGEVYDLKGDLKKATEYYQQTYELAPNEPSLALTLADALARGGRTPEAKRLYQGVLKARPDNATAMNNLAFLIADTGGDLDEALRLAKQAMGKTPTEPNYSDTIGYIYLKQGQGDSALRTFGNLVRNNPMVATYRYHLGMALVAKGDKTAAKKELQAALAAHPGPQDEQRIKELLSKI
jgi:tetratricopeptide (TPR) repeat protein